MCKRFCNCNINFNFQYQSIPIILIKREMDLPDKEIQLKEIEKPFRCNVCALGFTNEDHLQVHKRRHEMSLNLSKINVGGAPNNEGFTDETPTPTRFLKGCEEVGLFQDLQNVNPFDVQFVKAASATPSSEETGFEFGFNFRHNPSAIIEASSNETSLNTPQVFGFQPSTPLTPKEDSAINAHKECDTTETETHDQDQSRQQPEKIGLDLSLIKTDPAIKPSETNKDGRLILSVKNKSNLRLNLSPDIGSIADTNHSTIKSPTVITTPPSSSEIISDDKFEDVGEKKGEKLERNRAAASRSRERRKMYISALENKCAGLQEKLGRIQSELIKSRAENMSLKEQLDLHSNCDVTTRTNDCTHSSQPTTVTNTFIVSPSNLQQQIFHPIILRQNIPNHISNINSRLMQLSPQSQVVSAEPFNLIQPSDNLIIQKKTKRGRPRKGCEKRVPELSFIPLPNPISSNSEPPAKIQIMPISAFKKRNNTKAVVHNSLKQVDKSL